MSCHHCSKYGHKMNKCPDRISKIKCYKCNQLGHYKNNCPSIKENEPSKIVKEIIIKPIQDESINPKIINRQEIIDFIIKVPNIIILI